MRKDFLSLLRNLTEGGCDFVIVGGVAAFLHGGTRVTYDIDIVPRLDEASWARTIDQIWDTGARPRIPEGRESISKLENIERWMRDKGLMALTFRSPDGGVEVDLLVKESHRFDELRSKAKRIEIEDCEYYVASIDDLIRMKTDAGRPQDILDIQQLEAIKGRLQGD